MLVLLLLFWFVLALKLQLEFSLEISGAMTGLTPITGLTPTTGLTVMGGDTVIGGGVITVTGGGRSGPGVGLQRGCEGFLAHTSSTAKALLAKNTVVRATAIRVFFIVILLVSLLETSCGLQDGYA
jgi:hypothetical protein